MVSYQTAALKPLTYGREEAMPRRCVRSVDRARVELETDLEIELEIDLEIDLEIELEIERKIELKIELKDRSKVL